MKVQADRDVCIGAGMCVMATDVVFDQDDDGIVVVLCGEEGPAQEEQERVRIAVDQCPSGALSVVVDSGGC